MTGLLVNRVFFDNGRETDGISSSTTSSIFSGCDALVDWAGVVDVVGRLCPASVTGLVNVMPVNWDQGYSLQGCSQTKHFLTAHRKSTKY